LPRAETNPKKGRKKVVDALLDAFFTDLQKYKREVHSAEVSLLRPRGKEGDPFRSRHLLSNAWCRRARTTEARRRKRRRKTRVAWS
jgi:hypothetical protein